MSTSCGVPARVEHQLSIDGKQRVPPKTPRSRRTIPLPQVVAEAMSLHIAEFPPVDGLIFTTKHGLPWRREYDGQRTFKRAARDAGVGWCDDPRFAAPLRLGTARGWRVDRWRRRADGRLSQMVLKVYGQLMPDSEDRTRRAINAAWTDDGRGTDGGGHREIPRLVSN